MPEYDVRCPVHGDGVTFGSMKQAIDKTLSCFIEGCTESVTRIFPPGRYAADHSENTFKPWHSEQLTLHNDPVYVKSRAEERGMMGSMGLQRWEPGMKSDTAKLAEKNRRRKEAARRG